MSKDIAVLYKSKYGSSKTYSKWISDKLHADIFEIGHVSLNTLNDYNKIIFVSALYAGKLSAIKTIRKLYNSLHNNKKIYCVVIGIGDPNDKDIYNASLDKNFKPNEKENIKFYFLRGCIDFDKLKIHHALMMHMLKTIISSKAVKTEDEEMLLKNYGKKIDFLNKNSVDNIISDIKKKSE
ncbi:flavodoxin domain-containing protein [Brachyspira pilosicoli]|uniref:flavodoxin domain-containing protein n=1 Tax=Brachyspira pilosicoli TaxID=52584 RepID=UPI001CA5B1E5|nr:flavodoxin domain-containing protein [Brachyspira pilosicoli]MBW5381933.1 flavodoxin [Brachyspira pilosicoli]